MSKKFEKLQWLKKNAAIQQQEAQSLLDKATQTTDKNPIVVFHDNPEEGLEIPNSYLIKAAEMWLKDMEIVSATYQVVENNVF